MSECLKPHTLAHTLMGVGIGLALAALSQVIYDWALTLGIIAIVVAFLGEFLWNKQ